MQSVDIPRMRASAACANGRIQFTQLDVRHQRVLTFAMDVHSAAQSLAAPSQNSKRPALLGVGLDALEQRVQFIQFLEDRHHASQVAALVSRAHRDPRDDLLDLLGQHESLAARAAAVVTGRAPRLVLGLALVSLRFIAQFGTIVFLVD